MFVCLFVLLKHTQDMILNIPLSVVFLSSMHRNLAAFFTHEDSLTGLNIKVATRFSDKDTSRIRFLKSLNKQHV